MSSISPPAAAYDGNGWPAARGPIPWTDFKAELLALYTPPMRSPATFAKIRHTLDQVAALGVTSTEQIAPALVARFITARPPGENPNSTFGHVAVLRVLCNYAAAQGYCRMSPFALRKQWVRRVPPRRMKRHHTREEIARVLAMGRREIDSKTSWAQWRARRLYTLAALVAYTGLRKTEALFLRVEDIDFEARMVLIHADRHRLKTEGSAQPVPMPDALLPILCDWLPHLAIPADLPPASEADGPMPRANPKGIRDPGWLVPNAYRTGPWVGGTPGHRPLDRLKRLGEKAGVPGFTFQSLRHSYATHAEFWGLSDAMIQRVLRHTTTRTQWHYRHADVENMRSKVGGIGFGGDVAGDEAAAANLAPMPPALVPAAPPAPRADRSPKLSDADVAELRELRALGWTYKALCARYQVAASTLHAALHHITHRELP